jgi:hypothetical protein
MRWTGQIFWLLAFEDVEKFIVERLRETEKHLASQVLNPSTPQLILHLLPAFTARLTERLAHGKLYPVTAAQLLPIRTGFLAPIHSLSSQRTKIDN